MEKSLLQTSYNRFDEAHRSWHLALDGYHSVDDFRANINSMIQSLRNITFALQKQKNDLPNFDVWYLGWQSKMKDNFILKKIHNARNVIVKQDDLELSSIGIATLKNWEQVVIKSFKFNALSETSDVAEYVLEEIKLDPAIEQDYLHRMVFEFERVWIYKEIEDYELLSALSEAYLFFHHMMIDASLYFKINKVEYKKNTYCNHRQNTDGDLICMITTKQNRTLSINPSTRESVKPIDFKFEPSKELHEKAIERHGANPSKKWSPILNKFFPSKKPYRIMKKLFAISLFMYQKDKDLLATIFLFKEDSMNYIMRPIVFRDQQEKMRHISDIVEEIKKEEITSVLFIGETWVIPVEKMEGYYKNGNQDGCTEALEASIIMNDRVRIIHVPIVDKEGSVSYGDISKRDMDKDDYSGILGSMIQAIQENTE
jgi:hypothetical protein